MCADIHTRSTCCFFAYRTCHIHTRYLVRGISQPALRRTVREMPPHSHPQPGKLVTRQIPQSTGRMEQNKNSRFGVNNVTNVQIVAPNIELQGFKYSSNSRVASKLECLQASGLLLTVPPPTQEDSEHSWQDSREFCCQFSSSLLLIGSPRQRQRVALGCMDTTLCISWNCRGPFSHFDWSTCRAALFVRNNS